MYMYVCTEGGRGGEGRERKGKKVAGVDFFPRSPLGYKRTQEKRFTSSDGRPND